MSFGALLYRSPLRLLCVCACIAPLNRLHQSASSLALCMRQTQSPFHTVCVCACVRWPLEVMAAGVCLGGIKTTANGL